MPGGAAHSGGYGANAGTAARSAHCPSCPARHERHSTRSVMVSTGPAHEAPPGTLTSAQDAGKPSPDGRRSSAVPHVRSAPPHALQMRVPARAVAAAIAASARPSPGTGQRFACWPFTRAPQQRASAFDALVISRALSLVTAAAHRASVLLDGSGTVAA